MQINILNSVIQTILFILLLTAFIFLTSKKDLKSHEMNPLHTYELKGIAMLMILFSYIGYFIFGEGDFLYPLAIAGGVGVNVFLFLSGFGLTTSHINSHKEVLAFYYKRLRSIFIPMWIVLFTVLILDAYLLGKTYDIRTIIQSVIGIFPVADVYNSIDSPLWYFSLILFYYLIFPVVYRKKYPYVSITLVFLFGYILTSIQLPVSSDVLKLYELHYMAFPFGMLFAHIYEKKPGIKLKKKLLKLVPYPKMISFSSYILVFILSLAFGYLTVYASSFSDKRILEQLISLFAVLILVFIFLIKDFQSKLLILLGKYSYEICLIQWPLMYKYDILYRYFAPSIATLLYILVFISLGFVLHKSVKLLFLSK